MSECDVIVHRKNTCNDYSLIAINRGIVNNSIEMGVEGGSLENQIYINLIAVACNGTDYLVIHDESSTKLKDMGVRFNLTRGFDGVVYKGKSLNGTKSFFFGVE